MVVVESFVLLFPFVPSVTTVLQFLRKLLCEEMLDFESAIRCVCVSQIRYAVKEYACTAIDVIARRLRLAFLNVQAAHEALPAIVDILAEELKWSNDAKKVRCLCWFCNNICEKLHNVITMRVAVEE